MMTPISIKGDDRHAMTNHAKKGQKRANLRPIDRDETYLRASGEREHIQRPAWK